MKNYSNKLRLALFALVIFFILIVSIFFSTQNQRIETGQPYTFNNGWEVYLNNEFVKETALPDKIDADKNDEVKILQILNDDFEHNQIVLIRGSLQEILVRVDDQIIYEKTFEDNAFNTPASLYHFINVPENSNGKTIEIVLTSPYRSMSGTINEVNYGNHSTLRDLLLDQHEFKLYVAIFLFIISIIFIISNLLFFKQQQSQQIYLGIFGMFIGLWLFAESKIAQLYFNNDFFIGSLAYLSLATAPIAAAAFIKYYIFDDIKKIYSYLCLIFSFNLLTVILLHVFQVLAFFETVSITLGLLTIGFIITFILLIIEYTKTKIIKYRNYTLILLLFSIFILLEVINFANKEFLSIANFASTGIASILIFIFILNVFNLVRKLKSSFEQQIYEEIANTDQLTKAGSRFAFEKEFDKLFYDGKEEISLVYFDFDDLKHINDYYGHIEGDITLIEGYNAIQKIFGEYGKCYRIGGDEFACLIGEFNEKTYQELKEKLNDLLKTIHLDKPYSINVSIGYTKLNPKIDKKPSDLIIRADKQMYLDKKNKKAQAK